MLYNIAGSLTSRWSDSWSGYLVLKGFSKKIRTQTGEEVANKFSELYRRFPEEATLRFLKESSRVQNILQIANVSRLVHRLLSKQIEIDDELWRVIQNVKVKPKAAISEQKFNPGLVKVYLAYLFRLNQRKESYVTFKKRLKLPDCHIENIRMSKELLYCLFVMRKLPVYLQHLEWLNSQTGLMREWLEEVVEMLKLLVDMVKQLLPQLHKKNYVYQIYQLYEKLLSTLKAVAKVIDMTPKQIHKDFVHRLPTFPFDRDENAKIQKINQENTGNQIMSAQNFFKELQPNKLESQETGQQLFDLI